MPNNFEDAARMLCTAGGGIRIRDPKTADTFYFQAAALGWEAAKLMPDNSEETARVLCMAGGGIKYSDPQKADIFYKALVRRNRKTAIGMEADRIRWFPRLDEQGNLIPRKPSLHQPSAEQPSDTEPAPVMLPVPGKYYIIHAGDTLAMIAQVANGFGQPITLAEILEANPGLDATRLMPTGALPLSPRRQLPRPASSACPAHLRAKCRLNPTPQVFFRPLTLTFDVVPKPLGFSSAWRYFRLKLWHEVKSVLPSSFSQTS
jgi:hypothetical protein